MLSDPLKAKYSTCQKHVEKINFLKGTLKRRASNRVIHRLLRLANFAHRLVLPERATITNKHTEVAF